MAAKKTTKNTTKSMKTVKSKATERKAPLGSDDLIDRGKRALALAEEFSIVKERLTPGLLPDLSSDINFLLPGEKQSIITTQTVRAATQAQDYAIVDLYKSLSAARLGIQKTVKNKEVRLGYGFGIKLNASSLPALVAAGEKLIERARGNIDEARGLGILEKDVTNIETLITAVESADGKQRDLIVAKPKTTRELNAAGNRVWKAIVTIASRGVMAFPLDEVVRARFDVLDDLPKKNTKK